MAMRPHFVEGTTARAFSGTPQHKGLVPDAASQADRSTEGKRARRLLQQSRGMRATSAVLERASRGGASGSWNKECERWFNGGTHRELHSPLKTLGACKSETPVAGIAARGKSPATFKRRCIPAELRCSSVEYVQYAPSSRLVSRAPRHSRCYAGFHHGLPGPITFHA